MPYINEWSAIRLDVSHESYKTKNYNKEFGLLILDLAKSNGSTQHHHENKQKGKTIKKKKQLSESISTLSTWLLY